MKPAPFNYHRPQSLAAVFECYERLTGDVRLIAGGQSLGPMLNLRLARPDHLVDLNDLLEFDFVREAATTIEIGSLTRHHRLATDPQVRAASPLLSAAARSIGHYAIRQRGTLGGSLAHADPAAQLPLLAVLLDAEIACASASAQRRIKAGDFFQSIMTTALARGEIITGVRFPRLPPHTGWGFELFSRRHGDFAIAAVGALVTLGEQGRVADMRIAIGGVASMPVRLDTITRRFVDQPPDEAWLKAAAEAVAEGCLIDEEERISVAFRRDLMRALTHRACAAAVQRADEAS